MNIKVNSHTLEINQNIDINTGEYNITTLNFEFSDEYEGLTKMAVFSNCETSIKTAILNNQCTIPFEVLEEPGQVLLGVYGYEGEDDSLELRYSPEPQYFNVKHGSYQEGGEPTIPPKSEWEEVVEEVNQAIDEANNLNITANKEGKVTTVTITKKDGTTQEVEINDGKDLEFNWEGTSLGVRQEGQSEYEYTNLKGAKGDTGATPNIQIGDVQTGDSSEVTRTGTDENPILNFTLEKGDTGNGIASIAKTSTSGLVDTYTITFTNGQTTTFEVTNGANGDVVDVQVDGTSVVDDGVANIILAEMKQELEDMYNLLPKVSGTGETITLDGTVAGKMLIDLKGNTSQEGTPTPDSPQPIQVVKGNNTITISNSDNTQSQNYQITLGSSTNTFDVSKVLQGVYSDISQYNSKRLTLFGELKSNGYVVNVVCNNPNLQFDILRTSMNTISSSNQNLQASGYYPNYSSLEFDGEGYVCILIRKADDSDITINDISSNDFNISESYELCKLGDYQDYIYKNNENWYFHKNILKVCINGENWVKQADYVFYKRFLYITDKTTKQQTYCNQFIWDGRGSGMTGLADNHFAQQATTALYVMDNRNQNLSTFDAWVNANPLIVYFRLTTPTDTQITDSTLISQLEAVKRSYDEQTNISQNNNDLPFIINATALKEMA